MFPVKNGLIQMLYVCLFSSLL